MPAVRSLSVTVMGWSSRPRIVLGGQPSRPAPSRRPARRGRTRRGIARGGCAMHAIRVSRIGDPSVLEYVSVEKPTPGKGEALVRIEAIGVNYVDVYHRNGLYKVPLPLTPGSEAAGVVEAVGPDVEGLKGGDRVAYAMHIGSYAEHAVVPAWRLVPVAP